MNEVARRERLHKVLARAGIAGRRTCEEYIAQGRVKVDGQVVTRQGVLVDPSSQEIRFDEEVVRCEPPAYYLVYKPKGVVCTTRDQFRRCSVVDLVSDWRGRRLFPVGRLEEDSEGLILVTNDGALAHRLLRHGRGLRQTWFVRARGTLSPEALEKVRTGVWLSEGRTDPMEVRVQRAGKRVTTLLVTPSGRQHRLLRRVFAKVGVHLDKVVRVRIGSLTTRGLKKGGSRRLTPEEVDALLDPAPLDRLPGRRRSPRHAPPGPRRPGGSRRGCPPGARGSRRRRAAADGDPGRRVVGP